jgi:hypothetical protein
VIQAAAVPWTGWLAPIALTAACVAGGTTVAAAQATEPAPPPEPRPSPAQPQYQPTFAEPGLTFFPRPQPRGPLLLIPSLTVGAEWNDNIFLDNRRRDSDVILTATPGLQLVMETARYRLAAGYSFTAEKYFEEDRLDTPFRRHDFYVDGQYQVTPTVGVSVRDALTYSKDTHEASLLGVSAGRREALGNVLSVGATWRLTPRTSLQPSASWALQRFEGPGTADSDIYSAGATVVHRFTPRFDGTAGYEFAFIDTENAPDTTTHTPRVGASYDLTRTLKATLSVGPSIRRTDDDTDVSPAITATLVQQFRWGSAGVAYDRRIGTAGGLGGTTDNQIVSGSLRVTGLYRDLVLELLPAYRVADSVDGGAVDVQALTVTLRAAYQFTPWLAGVASYTFYHQRSEGAAAAVARDVDQNRVFVGLNFAFPFRRD